MCKILEEEDCLFISTGSNKFDKDLQDCGDVGTEPQTDDIAVDDRGDDGLGVGLGNLSGHLQCPVARCSFG